MSEFSNEANRALRVVLATGYVLLQPNMVVVSVCVHVCVSACVRAGFGLLFPTCGGAMQNYVLRIK